MTAGAPPRWQGFGAAMVVAAGMHLTWTLYGASSEVTALLDDRDPTMGRTVPAAVRLAMLAGKEAVRQQATLALGGAAVAVALAVAVVPIGLGIRRGELRWLQRARPWAWCALGALAMWLGMRMALVPAQRRALELLRDATAANTPYGADLFEGVGRTFVTWPLLAALLQALAPLAVAIWATRTLRETRAPADHKKHEAPPSGRASRSQGS